MKRSHLCVSCSCGNIECTRIEQRNPKELFISSKALSELKEEKLSFSMIFPKSMIIHNQNIINVTHHSGMTYAFYCSKCKETFYIFPSHSKFSVGFPETAQLIHKEKIINGESETPNKQIPIILRPFIHVVPTKQQPNDLEFDEIDPVDIDDEYMFSPTKNECIIGSYEDRPMLLTDDII